MEDKPTEQTATDINGTDGAPNIAASPMEVDTASNPLPLPVTIEATAESKTATMAQQPGDGGQTVKSPVAATPTETEVNKPNEPTPAPATATRAPIELPSIGAVTGGMKAGGATAMPGGAGSKVPHIAAAAPRPNIIQLPGSMLAAKMPTNSIPSIHPGPPMPGANRMPAGYAGGPGSGPYGMPPPGAPVPPAAPSQKMELHDAFAYLDRVKAEFSDQPEVYNRFLQIMREFKANAIDANGVIVRVVQLFKGHRALIQGFNAFLPRSHHIDPVVAETGILPPHLMAVAQSMGIGLTPQGIPISLSLGGSGPSQQTASSNNAPPQYGGQPHWDGAPGASYYQGPPQSQGPHPQYGGYQSMPPRPVAPISTAPMPPAGAPPTGPMTIPPGASTPTNKKSSAQFVRAISYVKKIKHRFANEPDVYKTFLAALHSYHREQKTIFEVYMEVANLFSEHPDLLEEFVLFLPENEATSIGNKLAQVGLAPPTGSRSGGAKDNSRVASLSDMTLVVTGSKRAAAAASAAPPPPSRAVKRARQAAAAMSNRTAEESAFYERVKRYLGDKQAYQEFLKCLNLFCQDIIKINDLVQLVSRFIGQNEELFGWFKKYIGYKEGSAPMTMASGSAETSIWRHDNNLVNEAGELNLQACKKVGSYRIYPRSHILPRSSHRTAIGLEVLNDMAVSCPVFNSEDSTFIASKKNQYEEALFRCEDERFEMDLLLEYNLATIAVFEPLARKIELMSAEERNAFTLGPNLGGTSTVIYHKAIRKIYGDKAEEVISGLQKNPAVAIPVVLRRLKQKDEEWRRIQRDWNKIWRDTHIKNYYKALDHQGIEFKSNDRRTITGRNLFTELETIAMERKRALDRGEPMTAMTAHLEFTVTKAGDRTEDLSRIVRSYVKSSPSFSGNDRKAILKFLGSFLPHFFAISPLNGGGDQVVSATAGQKGGSLSGGNPSDVSDASGSEDDAAETDDAITKSSAVLIDNTKPPVTSSVLLFANVNLYVLVRLVTMALERLERMQTAASAANGQPFFTEKKNVVASFLDLQENATEQMVTDDSKGDFYSTLLVLLRQLVCNNIDPGVFEERVRFMFGTAAYPVFTFDKLLQAIVKQVQVILADGPSEQLIRLFDSLNARKNMVRVGEYSARLAAEGVLPLANFNSSTGNTTSRDKDKDALGGNANSQLIRVEFNPLTGRLTMQLLDRLSDGGAAGALASPESRWSTYVDNYVKLEANPALLPPSTRLYLERSRRRAPELSPTNPLIHYNMECKIAINTYKLIYVENTEDFLLRYPYGQSDVIAKSTKVKNSRFLSCLTKLPAPHPSTPNL